MNTDPIADMLTRIRNAVAIRRSSVSVPHSKMKETVAKVLKDTQFINGYEVVDGVSGGRQLVVSLSDSDSNARINTIERMSKPGRRMYTSADDIPSFKQGRGLVVVSTSQGVMTGQEAKSKRLGGELICKVS